MRPLLGHHLRAPASHRQRGAALLVLLSILVLAGSALLLGTLNSAAKNRTERASRTADALAEAKAALIGWAVSHPNLPGMMPWPDRGGDGNYDGNGDCPSVAFNPSLALGKIPWLGQPVPCVTAHSGLGANPRDSAGEVLWMAVSQNLVREYVPKADPVINPSLLDAAPNPWLTVRDASGAIVSSRVAVVLIAPGDALEGQDRSGAAGPANFLDSVTVGGTPYDNADADQDFIAYPNSTLTPDPNDRFNDQLVFITIDELMPLIERRVLGEVADLLGRYRGLFGAYPWVSPFADPRPTALLVTPTHRRGVATAGSTLLTLEDTTRDFTVDGVLPGDVVRNITDGSKGMVISVNPTTLVAVSLEGGGGNDFAANDEYEIRRQLAGTATALSSGTTLEDTSADFAALNVLVGDAVQNLSDGSRGVVTAVTPTTLAVALAGGTSVFDPGDAYVIARSNGVIGIREGLLPFHEAGEAFNTSFGLSWSLTGAVPSIPGTPLASYTSHLTQVTDSSALSGSIQVPLDGGSCRWTNRDDVDCRGQLTNLAVLTGSATAGSASLVLEDATRDFSAWGVSPGDLVRNSTDGSIGVVNTVGVTTLSAVALSGGTENDFDPVEDYQVRIATQGFSGTATGGSGGLTLVDASKDFLLVENVEVGDTVRLASDGSAGIVDSVATTTLTVSSLDGTSSSFSSGDNYEVRRDFVDRRSYTFDIRAPGTAVTVNDAGVRRRDVTATALPALPAGPITVRDIDSVGNVVGTATLPGGAIGTITVAGMHYDFEEGADLPPWFVANDWHQLIHVAVSEGDRPGGPGCIPGGTPACLTLANWFVPDDDKQALVVSAGRALGGQDRSAPAVALIDYLEAGNSSPGDDAYQRDPLSTTFNDQARIVAP